MQTYAVLVIGLYELLPNWATRTSEIVSVFSQFSGCW
jgi:hypothetical protein